MALMFPSEVAEFTTAGEEQLYHFFSADEPMMDFATVFLAGFDASAGSDPDYRRLAYVGMTRARERLVLCTCRG